MAQIANDYKLGSQSTYVYGVDSYDSTKFGIGNMIIQNNGSTAQDKWIGPPVLGFARPFETGGAIPAQCPAAISWSSNIDWVFFADQAAAAATRRIQLYTFNRTTSEMTWRGFVTVSFPYGGTQGVYVVANLKAFYDKYTTGTAAVSGTTVTGTGTTWSASRIPAGCRIGFGSTDPTAITTWYEISSVGGDTTITLTGSAGTVVDGPYVIEDLRIVQSVTNGTTATNGGLCFLIKGIRYENFTGGGTAIAAATTTDNVARTNYWLGDAATSTDTASIGLDHLGKTDWQTHYVYGISTTANPVLYKYNIRAALTLSSGKDTTAFTLKSGSYGALTGAPVQINNFTIGTHYTASTTYTNCGWFTTASRIYRTVDVTTILSGSTVWAGEVVLEMPPGSTTTFAATGSLKQIHFSSKINRFIIPTGGRSYCTAFYADSSQWDRIWLTGDTMTRQMTADNTDTTPHPSYTIGVFFSCENNGILYLATTGLTAITNFVYAIPVGCDWEYTGATGSFTGSKQVVITPEITTSNVSAYKRAYFTSAQVIGQSSGQNLGTDVEPVRVSYRTSGISDDSGAWTILPVDGDMGDVDPATSCQLKFEFRIMGTTCVPCRLTALGIIYEDLSTDSHFQPSVGNSSIANKQFAWRLSTAFGTTIPTLRIRLYDAVAGSLLYDDDSVTRTGTWEKSTDGGSNWVTWNSTDKGNETTYLRFTPASLVDNVRVRALLTLY